MITNGSSRRPPSIRPITTAMAMDTAAVITRTTLLMPVLSGRPLSSSRACAPMPTARKNASSVAPSRQSTGCGTSAAPIAT